jgi:hypothetical protein
MFGVQSLLTTGHSQQQTISYVAETQQLTHEEDIQATFPTSDA